MCPTFCYYALDGEDSSTPIGFRYDENTFPDSASINRSMGKGDGMVNKEISEICLKWRNERRAPFESHIFDSHHMLIIYLHDLFAAIGKIVSAQENGTGTAITSIFTSLLAAMLVCMLVDE